MNIAIVSGSARPGRKSHQVALFVKERLAHLAHPEDPASALPEISTWIWDIKETNLPLLDHVFDQHPEPGKVLQDLKERLDKTTAFILVSPEHNASYPGSLKNSMDYFYKEYSNKPFGIVGVSNGVLGGINAVKNLQQYALKLNGLVCPQFMITPSVQKVFADGQLIDEKYAERMDKFLAAFLALARLLKG